MNESVPPSGPPPPSLTLPPVHDPRKGVSWRLTLPVLLLPVPVIAVGYAAVAHDSKGDAALVIVLIMASISALCALIGGFMISSRFREPVSKVLGGLGLAVGLAAVYFALIFGGCLLALGGPDFK